MRKLIVLALVLAVAFVAAPAFASVQNIKISGSVDSTLVIRQNFDFGENNPGGDEEQDDFITQTYLNVDADLTDQVAGHVKIGNERAWGEDSSANNQINLVEAYIKLREMLYSPLTVVIGRQSFHYGNSFIMDSAGLNNSAPAQSGIDSIAEDLTKETTLDALRAALNYDPLLVELFYAVASNGNAGLHDQEDDDDHEVWGINNTYNLGDDMNTQVEGYFFAKRDKDEGADAARDEDNIYVYGGRTSANVLEGLALQLEYAHQTGNKYLGGTADNVNRNANAVQAIASWQVPNFAGGMDELNPTLQYVFSWFEGQGDTSNTAGEVEWEAWDPFYENQGSGKIYNTLFNYTNAFIHEVSLTLTPMEDVTSTLSWTGLWLDKEIAEGASLALLSPGGAAVASPSISNTESELGHEFDLVTTYDYTEDVQFGLNLGWYLPGDVFTGGNQDSAMQILANANLAF